MYLRSLDRRALTLVEMLVAMAVLGILAVGLGAMVTTIHQSNDFVRREGEALQHARIAMERIKRTCQSAHATADYPGFWTVATTSGSYSFPDALVVWSPASGAAANAAGPPLLSELVIFTFDASSPEKLIEISARSASGTAPAINQSVAWLLLVAVAKASSAVEKIELTDLLRVADAGSGGADWRGVIRFETRYHPTEAERTAHLTGSRDWEDLTWPLGNYGSDYGVRQSWCAMELQLVPRGMTRRGSDAEAHTQAYFGSATRNYTLTP